MSPFAKFFRYACRFAAFALAYAAVLRAGGDGETAVMAGLSVYFAISALTPPEWF